MPPPTNPAYNQAMAQIGRLEVPVHPEAGVVKIDMFIASKYVSKWTVNGDGNDRTFDPNASNNRSKAVFVLDFVNGTGSIYVSPSCITMGSSVCRDAYPLSGDLGHESNGVQSAIDGDSQLLIKYSFENSAPSNLRSWTPIHWFAESTNPSIDGELTIGPDPQQGWSRPRVTGTIDRFPSVEMCQFAPGGSVRTLCTFSESPEGISAFRGKRIDLGNQCTQLAPAMSVGGL